MGKYRTVVIDPPWEIVLCNPEHCKGPITEKLPYEVMSDNALFNFNISQFAGDECDLFMWTTKAKLHTAFHLLKAWGFHYSNLMVWNKKDGLCTNGFHNTLEFVLHGYRGKNNVDFTKPLEVYFEAKRLKHSQKPDIFYNTLLKVTSPLRVDLFARRRHVGFEPWGNEVESEPTTLLSVVSKSNEEVSP